MARKYKKKSQRGIYGESQLQAALQAVEGGMPLIRASKTHGVPARTLRRHRDKRVLFPGKVKLGRYQSTLPSEVEAALYDHIKFMEKRLYGLTTIDVRRLAFDVAEKWGIDCPFNKTTRMAGKDWLAGFFSRFPGLSIREPQGTSIARAVGFNRPKVDQFFNLYKEVLQENVSAMRVWNMDETGISTVQKPSKIVATKGVRQVGKMISGEKGRTITAICAMNAAGSYLPPALIFPRKRMVEVLMHGAPPDSLGLVSASGWTDGDLFVQWLEHFQKVTQATRESPHIIILDGHHSHKTLAAVDFAREHGIYMITLPPHCTHKMQPLDRTYFKSFKASYNAAADSWMVANPGKRISFYDVAGIFGKAYVRTATPEKAIKGFEMCGLWPFDPEVFQDEDFAAAEVTNEDAPNAAESSRAENATSEPQGEPSTQPQTRGTLPCAEPTPEPHEDPTTVVTVALVHHTNDESVEQDDGARDKTPSRDANEDSEQHPCSTNNGERKQRNAGISLASSSNYISAVDLIQALSPVPKLSTPRTRKRKAESAAILTSSPFKKTLQEKQAAKQKKSVKVTQNREQPAKGRKNADVRKTKGKSKKQSQRGKSKSGQDSESSDDEDWPCIVCAELWTNSRSREVWVECQLCKKWAHEKCTPGTHFFICPNCDSGSDISGGDESDDDIQ